MRLLLKAIIPGGAAADLFSVHVPIAAHDTKAGVHVEAYTAVRHVKAPEPAKTPPRPIIMATPKPVDAPPDVSQPYDTVRHQAGGIGKGPAMNIQITQSASGKGTYLKLPPGATALHEAFKAAFPAATFYSDSGKWYLVGKTAEKRLRAWADDQAGALAELEAAATVQATAVISAKQAAAAADEALGKLTTPSVTVSSSGGGFLVGFPYSPAAVSIIKGVPSARWDAANKGWLVAKIERPALRAAIAKIEPIAAAAIAEQRAAVAAKQAVRAETQARRWPVLMRDNPRAGNIIKMGGGKIAVIESVGRQFRVDEDMPSMYGHLLGSEGEGVAYAYLRDPTDAETAAHEAVQSARSAKTEKSIAANALMRDTKAKFDVMAETPAGPLELPVGETIAEENPALAIYGGGVRWIQDNDGVLWRLRGNGGDGDDWSRNNMRSTIASRVSGPVAFELAERMRQAVAMKGEP